MQLEVETEAGRWACEEIRVESTHSSGALTRVFLSVSLVAARRGSDAVVDQNGLGEEIAGIVSKHTTVTKGGGL